MALTDFSNPWNTQIFGGYDKVEKVQKTPVVINGETSRFSDEQYDESEIKMDLAYKLINEIVTKKLMNIRRDYSVHTDKNIFSTSVQLVPLNYQHTMLDRKNTEFECRGQFFTKEEIDEALQETFPERFV